MRAASSSLHPAGGLADRLLLILAAAFVSALGVATVATGLATALAGNGWHILAATDAATALTSWTRHPGDPRAGYPEPLRTQLPGPVAMWTALLLTTTTAAALGTGGWLAVRPLRRRHAKLAGTSASSARSGGTGAAGQGQHAHAGMATRRDLRVHLSEQAVRARTPHTRPSLAHARRYATTEVGLTLGTDRRHGTPLWGSVEDSYLVLGPPRSGKGVHLVIPHTLDAPGSVLVTGTRPDAFHASHAARARLGPVLAFDPQQLVPEAPRLRWSPTRGCDDPLVALSRARALATGTGLNGSGVSDAQFWQQMTAAVLRAYLHAAALTDRPMRELLAWASRPSDPTPVRILRSETGAADGWAEELAAQAGADPRQRDSVWAGVRRAVDSLADPRVLDTCSPDVHDAFDPRAFLRDRGSLYLLGSTGTQLTVAPLISALLDDLLDTARTLAAGSAHGRLDPPLLLLLDEAANIAPLPTLPNLLADGGGSGITTVVVLQSLAQARSRWGDSGADAIWDAATTKVVLGGLAHADDLQRISRLAGEVDLPHHTRSHGTGGPSHSTTSRRLPVLPLERIRCQPAGQALLLARRCPPAEVRLTPWWKHPSQTTTTSKAKTRSLR
jgi:type IV secretion system protein VirD4